MSEIFKKNDYVSRCSEKTLQSTDEGFFLTLANHFEDKAGEIWINKKFGQLKHDRERLKILYEYEPVKLALVDILSNVQEIYRGKSSEVSLARRNEAAKLLEENNLVRSLSLYSQSILRAQKTGENLEVDNGNSMSLALFGRSKVLMKMGKFSNAVVDIQNALKENLPEIQKGEAYFKLAVCYKALNQDKKADVAFGIAETLLKINKDILLRRFQNEFSSISQCEEDKSQLMGVPKIHGKPNKFFPNAVDTLEVKFSPSLGRHVVSKGKINTGETLVVESPVAACLLPDAFGNHCHNCFVRLLSPLGCPTCVNVAFCGQSCRDEALGSYHNYECKILELLIGSGGSVLSHLALRMVTQRNLKDNLSIFENRANEHVFTLCTNSEKRSAEDFFRRTLMASFLLRCLQKVGYFGVSKSVIPTEDEFTIGEMLLFYLQMLQFNAHELYEKIHPHNHRFKGSKINPIGVGIYPTVALFNHQCYPSVTRYFVGKNIVINTIKPLNKGDVVGENYGPLFSKKPLPTRQKILSARYWFNCECIACVQDWPMINANSDDISIRLRCPTMNCGQIFTSLEQGMVQCKRCKKDVNLQGALEKLKFCEEQYYCGLEKMDKMETIEGIEILKKALDEFHEISVPPHKGTHIAEETLKALYADVGNTYETLGK